jgi:hypothetical protein
MGCFGRWSGPLPNCLYLTARLEVMIRRDGGCVIDTLPGGPSAKNARRAGAPESPVTASRRRTMVQARSGVSAHADQQETNRGEDARTGRGETARPEHDSHLGQQYYYNTTWDHRSGVAR